ncbi:MAG: pantetheine-phosphate adenylyltransferase [Zoogloeaceae bacterium]|jgi:pantetheine-phosphate adenylyltransferase|nr:pantetheine-phosphate adenylyltransferase [Zoogloeaceae bacterium]
MSASVSRIAVFPGTFDPLTLGHENIARRAAALFDTLFFAIADSPKKRTLFSLAERIALAKDALADVDNLQVVGFSGLLVELMAEREANILVRGVRSHTDFDYESQLDGLYRQLNPAIETVLLLPREPVQFISSTQVREIARLAGRLDPFVSPGVAAALSRLDFSD